jgi:hypothetical protein
VTTLVDAGNTDTFGARYLFATADRAEVAAQVRAAVTFTPDLALDLYLEPFVSTGRYGDYGDLATPRSNRLRGYGDVRRDGDELILADGAQRFVVPVPDFTARSLRSTAVLRWEPRAGSTVFAVWQQESASFETRARATGAGLVDAVRAPDTQVFAVKIAWWWSR